MKRPAKQPTCDAPDSVRAAKLELRALHAAAVATRKRWYEARTAAKAAMDKPVTCATTVEMLKNIGALTFTLWLDEAALEACAARWRVILDERRALPVDKRWNQADLEAWAAWAPAVLSIPGL